MKNLSFSQKNDLVVKHKSKTGFWKDLELFKKHFPSNRLMNDLARANDFTCERLDGQMLYLLLEKLSIDDILSNREGKEQDVEINESDISDLQSKLKDKDASIEELQSKIEGLEQKAQKKSEQNPKNSPP